MPFPGDKFRPSAAREREVTKLIETARGERASFGVPTLDGLAPGHAIAKNDTGADLTFAKPAFLEQTGFVNTERTPRVDLEYRRGRYNLKPWNPVVDDMRVSAMAVTLEPIKAGALGVVAIAGLAICDGASGSGYVAPGASGTTSGGMFGFAKVKSSANGQGFGIIDLSDLCLFNVYTITSIAPTPRTITATFFDAPGTYSTVIRDPYSIAGWQVVGDKGIAVWTGSQWHIITPWCVGA